MKKLLLILLSLVLLAACQPTPEEDAVISKREDNTTSAAVIDKAQTATEYRETLTENGVTIEFSASVTAPDGDRLPSYALSAAGFSEEQLPVIVKALFGDEPIYESGEPTKEELYPQLLAALEKLEEVKSNPNAYEGGIQSFQDDVNELQAAYNAAPDSDTLVQKTAVFATSDEDHSGVFGCRGKGGKSTYATLFVNTPIGTGSEEKAFLIYQNPERHVGISFAKEVNPILTVPDPVVSQAEAVRIATGLVERMGVTEYRVAGCEPGVRKDPYTGWYEADSDETPFLVFFTRCMDGMQVTFDAHEYAESNFGEAYAEPMPYERLTVGVDSKGVCSVFWNGPVTIGNCIEENCKILSVDQAAQQAAKYLSFLYPVSDAINDSNTEGQAQSQEQLSRGSVQTVTVKVDRIVLGWMQVREGSSVKNSRLVPVWDFFGTVTREYQNGETVVTDPGLMSLLTLDAQTGARIDRVHGY
jgi:hypothetical protein